MSLYWLFIAEKRPSPEALCKDIKTQFNQKLRLHTLRVQQQKNRNYVDRLVNEKADTFFISTNDSFGAVHIQASHHMIFATIKNSMMINQKDRS